MSRWYRAYEGTVTDAKLAEVALVAGCSRSVAIAAWHAVLENGATLNDGGRIDIPSRRIAAILCEPFNLIESVFLGFETTGLILDSRIVAWTKRQYESDTSTERVRKHRRNKPKATRNADETFHAADVTPPETETETESETDSSEPKGSSPRPWALPVGVSLQVWTDLLGNRKKKRLNNTPTAWKAFLDDLARVSIQTGIPPPKLIEMCAAKGWGAIYDPREQGNGQRGTSKIRATLDLLEARHH